ncbi:hypothetical protein ACJMK2_021286 [Sinanodonta woodiana]|uniref:Glutamate decarboxylase n=2 Tax=Sinanodonta woodiana TaxID=1069815 RepID=A0ABD3TGA3_SINWO
MALSSVLQKLKISCPGKFAPHSSVEKDEPLDTYKAEDNVQRSPSMDWSKFERHFASDFQGKEGASLVSSFLVEVQEILVKYLLSERDRGSKVLDFHHPHQLREIMEHCLDVDENPRDLEQLLSDCKETLKYGVRTGHPRFLNQLSTGIDVIGVAGEWVTAAANTNMFTYEMAPVFTLLEEIILQRMRKMVGWDDGDGIFAPGGAISNFYALIAARHHAFPEAKSRGMANMPRMKVFTSEQSHFSIKRAAILLGIGLDNVVNVKCDHRGRMLVGDLESMVKECIADGFHPLFVNATCGTTVLGAYDSISKIADVSEKYGMWLHVDGAWGGSALFSEKHKHLLDGLERADSMTWNPHKMMGVPLQCSAILLRKKGILSGANQLKAEYLFQQDKHYDTSYDTGDKTIQCGRHNDIFKLWLMWRAKGDAGFRAQIDQNFEKAKYMLQILESREEFEVVNHELDGPNVCFWYVPPALRQMPDGPERRSLLHKWHQG